MSHRSSRHKTKHHTCGGVCVLAVTDYNNPKSPTPICVAFPI